MRKYTLGSRAVAVVVAGCCTLGLWCLSIGAEGPSKRKRPNRPVATRRTDIELMEAQRIRERKARKEALLEYIEAVAMSGPQPEIHRPGLPLEHSVMPPARQVAHFGPTPLVDRAEEPQDKHPGLVPTRLVPAPDINGIAKAFSERFAAAFAAYDIDWPIERMNHFAWVPEYEGVHFCGWNGQIISVSPQLDESWLVRVRIRPLYKSTWMKTLMFDYVEETYSVSGKSITLVSTDAAIAKPQQQMFPVAL